MKQPRGIVVPALVLSALLALCLHSCWTIRKTDCFIRCEAQTEREATFTLHARRGGGAGKTIGEPVHLPGYPHRQYVKFATGFPAFKTFALAIESEADSVRLGNCRCFQDEYGLDAGKAIDLALSPLDDATLRDCGNGFQEIAKPGARPVLQFGLDAFALYRKTITLSFLVTIFLCYPFCALALLLYSRCRRQKRRFVTTPNGILVALSLVFWGLMPCAYRAATARHFFVDVQKAEEQLHQPIPAGGEAVPLRRADGLEIAARLYKNGGETPARGSVLLLHGNYPQAQDFPLYSLLAQALAERGFRVLALDFAGFGRSQTPFASAAPLRYDLESETEAALAYLKSLAPDEKKLSIIGHSLGANPALRVGLRDPDVRSIALIGPPRRAWERFHNTSDIDYFWLWALAVGVQRYSVAEPPAWYTPERLQSYFLEHDMAAELPDLRKWGHKPVHFLDGDREDQDDKDLVFLRDYVAQVAAPCEYATIRGADHNLNVQSANYWAFVMDFITSASGGSTAAPGVGAPPDFDSVTYDPPTLLAAVDLLEQWCGREESGRAGTVFHNILRLLFPFR